MSDDQLHVLGVDAGGSKTVCLLADAEGRVLAEARGGGANLHSAGEIEIHALLSRLFQDVLRERSVTPAAICVGMAGVDRLPGLRPRHDPTVRVIQSSATASLRSSSGRTCWYPLSGQ